MLLTRRFIAPFVAVSRLTSPSSKTLATQSDAHLRHQCSPDLTDQQSLVLDAVARGRSVFITGSAGTGKSLLLRHAIRVLRDIHPRHSVFVTASTGIAATAIGGQTLHSFAGIGTQSADDANAVLRDVLRNRPAARRWAAANALVVDEVSMIDGRLFDTLETIARRVRHRKSDDVWGGIQIIASGDFFQLPPINSPDPEKEFAFEADCWDASFDLQIDLSHVFRQSDAKFIELLQCIRLGRCNPDQLRLLDQCRVVQEDDGDQWPETVTSLYPLNRDVQRVNKQRLEELEREIVVYRAMDRGKNPWRKQLERGIAPDVLEVCVGARVMLIKNLDVERGLVNGSVGVVTEFVESSGRAISARICPDQLLPVVQFDVGVKVAVKPSSWDVMEGQVVLARRRQVPLILAWAVSVHKCQGMTLDRMHADLSRVFGCGMVYVVLSRVRSLQGLRLSGFNPSKIKAHPKVLQFYERLQFGQS
ncbi:hypothetical protein QJS04_geneDACA008732 [Acorus gramineus]|uniref:ATP-dependent DNA helicase n=1 Tax=Acorus gramineus TaxID=55184 RepID=A0AAV9AC24_ACOGR|nr:hypothetical protein QJS04_geneDACA008732 [Acorus gramineus]